MIKSHFNIQRIAWTGMMLFPVLFMSCDPKEFDLYRLVGKWEYIMEDVIIVETWNRADDNHLSGYGEEIALGDTTMTELFEIKKINGVPTYVATVGNQNDGKSVLFPLYAQDADMLEFRNPSHDFPQVIRYEMIEKRKLKVTIGKLDMDKKSNVEFDFVKR